MVPPAEAGNDIQPFLVRQPDRFKNASHAGGIDGDGFLTEDVLAGFDGGLQVPRPEVRNRSENHDVNVASAFASGGDATWGYNGHQGGRAWQITDPANPAHIFRKNPDDRLTERQDMANGKDDYFLEDPTHASGSDPNPIYFTEDSQFVDVVYYVDGNLWVHGKNHMSYRFYSNRSASSGGSGATHMRATFVVKGNIFFSDNIRLRNPSQDAAAFIAIRDPAVEDSGNVYIGDPRYGTVEDLNCFLYAENNFYDLNLNASGSKHFAINGNMTAGNQVVINRDYEEDGETYHSRMDLTLDSRLKTGSLELEGLPEVADDLDRPNEIVYWRVIE
jgi:hypothetical protein